VARIPFELDEEIKEAFVERIMIYGENSTYAKRPSMSQLLRSIVSLVVLMEHSELRNLLEMAGSAELILEDYLTLFKKGKEEDLIPEHFPAINESVLSVLDLLLSLDRQWITEEEFKQDLSKLEVSNLSHNILKKNTSELLSKKDSGIWGRMQEQKKKFVKQAFKSEIKKEIEK